MDWQKVDLTIEGHIGGEDHPNMPWALRQRNDDCYLNLFRVNRENTLMLVTADWIQPIMESEKDSKDTETAANSFMSIFGRFPRWVPNTWGWMNGAMAGGDCCDRCGIIMNLLNSMTRHWCDNCESEMNEEIAANPNVVFAFENGDLRAVA